MSRLSDRRAETPHHARYWDEYASFLERAGRHAESKAAAERAKQLGKR